jgi:SHS2 domain-containing protein
VGFEIIDISGDVGIRADGPTFGHALVSAGIGLYSLITDLEGVEERLTKDVEVEAETREELTIRYLNELVFLFDTYGLIGREIDVLRFPGNQGSVAGVFRVRGEEFDPARHERGLLVKAATYHNLTCALVEGRWLIEVMFDI